MISFIVGQREKGKMSSREKTQVQCQVNISWCSSRCISDSLQTGLKEDGVSSGIYYSCPLENVSKFSSVENRVQKKPAWIHVFFFYGVSICMGQTLKYLKASLFLVVQMFISTIQKQTNAYGKEEEVKYQKQNK